MGEQRRPPQPSWYIVQVESGSEERMCHAIRRACKELDRTLDGASHVGLAECFSPRFKTRKKRMGEWYDTERALLPGYVVAVAQDPAMLARALQNLQDFARVLANGQTYSPLDEAERRWLEAQSKEGDRTVPLSFGFKDGGKLVVTSGPLKGYETMVTSIDRKNCMAHVELH